ncbi:type VI secretion system baseplate subunit TssE [Photobacterium atrarenae]|uniref:Type VI secretion system baseplate subunit TssE n=1 Tax=Photobacterium atrarenae TaxID=865757 RepID=A0ABY5GBF2_9GAMM|nr:type VI secretion system baseplate subunit TssE [Photobacterium atrarenae]UTV26491.1 type VI secretion system baseplate subunit TssE [Photobacterium atrarenae]
MNLNRQLQPSFIDKLIDESPESERDSLSYFTWRDMKHSVRRDLENLLNAKKQWLTWPESLSELDRSVLSYGLPDFSSMPLSSMDGKERLCATIKETILKFEPRFIDVSVSIIEEEQPLERTLKLRIHALLHTRPEPEEIAFNSEVEPVSLGFTISES